MPIRPSSSWFNRLVHDETAATALEYGLILALVVLASMVALTEMASTVVGTWNHVASAVTSAS